MASSFRSDADSLEEVINCFCSGSQLTSLFPPQFKFLFNFFFWRRKKKWKKLNGGRRESKLFHKGWVSEWLKRLERFDLSASKSNGLNPEERERDAGRRSRLESGMEVKLTELINCWLLISAFQSHSSAALNLIWISIQSPELKEIRFNFYLIAAKKKNELKPKSQPAKPRFISILNSGLSLFAFLKMNSMRQNTLHFQKSN